MEFTAASRANQLEEVGGRQSVQGQPIEGQPVEGQPVQGQPVEGQPVQGQPVLPHHLLLMGPGSIGGCGYIFHRPTSYGAHQQHQGRHRAVAPSVSDSLREVLHDLLPSWVRRSCPTNARIQPEGSDKTAWPQRSAEAARQAPRAAEGLSTAETSHGGVTMRLPHELQCWEEGALPSLGASRSFSSPSASSACHARAYPASRR